MLLAAVLAAEGVSYVLVGSAGLYLHGKRVRVRDIDAAPAPDRQNLVRLYCVLSERALRARATPARSLATADIVAGRVEELLGTQPR